MIKFRLWHPSGVLADFEYDNLTQTAKEALTFLGDFVKAGWKAHEPQPGEAGDGEETFTVTHLLRRELERDGKTTECVDLYAEHPMMKHKFMVIYMNNRTMYEDFEAATGIAVKTIGFSATTIERGKSKSGDAMLTTVRNPFEVVAAINPNYNPDEPDPKKKKPKFIFSRWPKKEVAPFDRDKGLVHLEGLYTKVKKTWQTAIGNTEAALRRQWPDRALDTLEGPEQLSDDEIKFMIATLEKAAG